MKPSIYEPLRKIITTLVDEKEQERKERNLPRDEFSPEYRLGKEIHLNGATIVQWVKNFKANQPFTRAPKKKTIRTILTGFNHREDLAEDLKALEEALENYNERQAASQAEETRKRENESEHSTQPPVKRRRILPPSSNIDNDQLGSSWLGIITGLRAGTPYPARSIPKELQFNESVNILPDLADDEGLKDPAPQTNTTGLHPHGLEGFLKPVDRNKGTSNFQPSENPDDEVNTWASSSHLEFEL